MYIFLFNPIFDPLRIWGPIVLYFALSHNTGSDLGSAQGPESIKSTYSCLIENHADVCDGQTFAQFSSVG